MTQPSNSAFTTQSAMELPQIHLIGISARTNNANETNHKTAKISPIIARFWRDNLGEHIQQRTTPGRTFSVYTQYDSDEHGDYTYFYGEQVDSLDDIPEGMQTLTIPASQYTKFTTQAGPIPHIVINAWQQIWQTPPEQNQKRRAYKADFEIYDERATDPQNSIVDIYIGVE